MNALDFLEGIPIAGDRIALPTKGGWVKTSRHNFEVLADEIRAESGVPLDRILEIWMEEVQPEPMTEAELLSLLLNYKGDALTVKA